MAGSDLATDVLEACRAAGVMAATAESCTGGMVAAALTNIAGSSDVVDRGFVTYSNEAKSDLLGVPMDLIIEHGAVSEPVARAMAEGALARSRAGVTVAITGIAGPGGGSAEKPVGTVHVALVGPGSEESLSAHRHLRLPGDRRRIRQLSSQWALELLRRALSA